MMKTFLAKFDCLECGVMGCSPKPLFEHDSLVWEYGITPEPGQYFSSPAIRIRSSSSSSSPIPMYFRVYVTLPGSTNLIETFANSIEAIELNREFPSFRTRYHGRCILRFLRATSMESAENFRVKRQLSDEDLQRFKELFLLTVERSPHNIINWELSSRLELETQSVLYDEGWALTDMGVPFQTAALHNPPPPPLSVGVDPPIVPPPGNAFEEEEEEKEEEEEEEERDSTDDSDEPTGEEVDHAFAKNVESFFEPLEQEN